MKNTLLALILFLFASTGSFAQDESDLKNATAKLMYYSDEQNYEGLIEMIYPKVFEVLDKDAYKKAIEEKMKGKGYYVAMVRNDPSTDYGAITIYDGGLFCLVNYDIVMKVGFEEQIEAKDQEKTVNRFKKILGTEAVYFNGPANSLDAKKRIQVVAIADNSTYGEWRFVLNPEDTKEQQALHEDVRNALDPDFVPVKDNRVKENEVVEEKSDVEKAAAEKAALLKKHQDEQKKAPKKKS